MVLGMDEMEENLNCPNTSTDSSPSNCDGRFGRLGAKRAVVLDVIDQARGVPAFPVERFFDVQTLADERRNAAIRISWAALFTKAYGLASREIPELRQFYLAFPWPRYYQSSAVHNRDLSQSHRGRT